MKRVSDMTPGEVADGCEHVARILTNAGMTELAARARAAAIIRAAAKIVRESEATKEEPCPQCGEPTTYFQEGYCEQCYSENQHALDIHNASFDRWEGMSDAERSCEISEATKGET